MLTPQQVEEYRQRYNITPTTSTKPTSTGGVSPRMQRLQQVVNQKDGRDAIVNAAPVEQKNEGFLKSLIKDPIKTLVVKPGARIGQAIASPFITEQQNSASHQRDAISDQIMKTMDLAKKQTDPVKKADLVAKAKELNRQNVAYGNQAQEISESAKQIDDKVVVKLPTAGGSYSIEGQRGGASGFKQIVGDAAKSASYLISGEGVGGGIANSIKNQVARTAAKGAILGGELGSLNSAGESLIEDRPLASVVKTAAVGGLAGAAIGGVTGAVVGRTSRGKIPSSGDKSPLHYEAITPKTNELTPTEYEKLLGQGKISPKTRTSPAKYILSDSEKLAADKYKSILQSKDPVKNTINVVEEISNKDTQVGSYLRKNNAIFNGGELRNHILSKLEGVSDITVDESRLLKAKTELADNFVSALKKKDMESLWQARKAYDRQIEKSFTGAPTLQNTVKREFRNAIQDFISTKTDDVTYKGYMKDMSELFKMKDVLTSKATKERSLNSLQKWAKDNPTKWKAVEYIGGGTLLYGVAKKLGLTP